MLAMAIGTSSMTDSRDSHLAIRMAFSVDPEYSKKSRGWRGSYHSEGQKVARRDERKRTDDTVCLETACGRWDRGPCEMTLLSF
jgi:hypothetical protein